MNDRQQQQEPSFLQTGNATLAKALGLVVAVLATPALYDWTHVPVRRYLASMYGSDLAVWLSWGLAIAEAVVIYNVVAIALVFGLAWFMAWLAARGLGR